MDRASLPVYHVVVDTTAIGFDAAVDILPAAARSLAPAASARFRR